MKKFFGSIVILLVFVSVSSADDWHRGGSHHGRHHGVNRHVDVGVNLQFSSGSVYYHQSYSGPVYYDRVSTYQPVGHWENVITGYRRVTVPVYHEAVLKNYIINGELVQFLESEGWTEMVTYEEPIIQRLWVVR